VYATEYEYELPGVAPETLKLAVLVVSGSVNGVDAVSAPAPVNTTVPAAPLEALITVRATVAAVEPKVTRKYGETDVCVNETAELAAPTIPYVPLAADVYAVFESDAVVGAASSAVSLTQTSVSPYLRVTFGSTAATVALTVINASSGAAGTVVFTGFRWCVY